MLDKFREKGAIIARAGNRFYWDDCFSRAASLAYTSLFALVPIAALSFSLLSAFGVGKEQLDEIIKTVVEQYLPPSDNNQTNVLKEKVLENLKVFAENVSSSVSQLNAVILSVLIFTSIALINTVESALNAIWRVTSSASIASKIITFWAIVSFTPVLIAISIYWYPRAYLEGELGTATQALTFLIPVLANWLGLTLLFYRLPAANVRLQDAASGAFVSSLMFEAARRGFAYYVGKTTTYDLFYGAVLVTVPLFLFWLYVTWITILYGAEISYQSGSLKVLSGRRKYATDLGEIGAILGLRILLVIGNRFVRGEAPPSEGEIAIETGSDPQLVRTCLDVLSEACIITNPDRRLHSRTLVFSPERLTLGEVFKTFHSKEHLLTLARTNGQTEQEDTITPFYFIDRLRESALSISPERPVAEWTLSELLKYSEVAADNRAFLTNDHSNKGPNKIEWKI